MAVFAVSRTQRQLVETQRPWIEQKFRVALQLSSYAEPSTTAADGMRDESDGHVTRAITSEESHQMWVEIDGDSYGAAKAKDYILSLCNLQTTSSPSPVERSQNLMQITETLPQGFGDLLSGKLDKIAADTNTTITRIGRTDNLILYGDETNIAFALSLIENEHNKLLHGFREFSSRIYQDSPTTPKERLLDDAGNRNSSFSPAKTGTKLVQNIGLGVPDEGRKGASEANALQSGRPDRQSPKLISHSVSTPKIPTQHEQPKERKAVSVVSSMLKLGFPKEQVDVILRQLGPDADHNDVLWALVNQGSSKTDFVDVIDTKEEEERQRDMSDGYPQEDAENESNNLRPVIIDGSNVAMSFGNKDVFACKGIEVAVKWFCERGHKKIHVFVPAWRKEASKPETPITDQEILNELEKQKFLTWTPSRRTNGRRIVCYDDRYILRTAVEEDGIIVSNDNFRDIQNEKPEWRKVIEERLLMYAFVSDRFMPPDDPLGRHGPSLDNFLRMKPTMPDHLPQACPYGKKCTYGNKCKYYHPDRPNRLMKSISETLKERDKTRKEMAKLNNERSNSARFPAASTAPLLGYKPPEEVVTAPDWHTTPLPGASSSSQWSPQRKSNVSESSPLQVSPKRQSSPTHPYYANEPISQIPYQSGRNEVFGGQDPQRHHQVQQTLSQVPPRHLNTPPLGRSGHSAPLPNYSQQSQRANQQGMYTVPLHRYSAPCQQDRGYVQMEESLNGNRFSMPAVMYGSGESLGATPSAISVERRSSHDIIPEFHRLGIQEQSGIQLPREQQQQQQQQHNYNYGQPARQYHSGEQFPSQMRPTHPGDFTQGTNQSLAYHNSEQFLPRRQSTGMTSDQMMYSQPRHTSPPGYPSPSEPIRQNFPTVPIPATGVSYRPAEPSTMLSVEEQRRGNILHHLSVFYGEKKVESVMRRHPTETNPKKLIGYINTNT